MILVGDLNTSAAAIDCYPDRRNINITKLLHHDIDTDDNNDIEETIKNIQEVKPKYHNYHYYYYRKYVELE